MAFRNGTCLKIIIKVSVTNETCRLGSSILGAWVMVKVFVLLRTLFLTAPSLQFAYCFPCMRVHVLVNLRVQKQYVRVRVPLRLVSEQKFVRHTPVCRPTYTCHMILFRHSRIEITSTAYHLSVNQHSVRRSSPELNVCVSGNK